MLLNAVFEKIRIARTNPPYFDNYRRDSIFWYRLKFINFRFHCLHFTTPSLIPTKYNKMAAATRCRKRGFRKNFYKENKELWSSEINFRNEEEKAAAKENLVSLFDGRY